MYILAVYHCCLQLRAGILAQMPLPKTATIAARATEVYCEVWSVILQLVCQMSPTRAGDLTDLSQLLPYLRQLLTCCACAGLLDNAMISLTCGHCYCFDCQFREPLLKIQCRQCRERTGLVIESQLQLVVKCYKHMCYILGEELRRNPSVLGTPAKPEPKAELENLNKVELTLDEKNNEEVGIDEPKKDVVSKKKVLVMDPYFNPITEIVKEVEMGTKVSRAILIIKPPSKYLNAKLTLIQKKEQTDVTQAVKARKESISNVTRKRNNAMVLSQKLSKVRKTTNTKSRIHKKRVVLDKEVHAQDTTPRRRTKKLTSCRADSQGIVYVRKKKSVGNHISSTGTDSMADTPTSGEEIDIGIVDQPTVAKTPQSPNPKNYTRGEIRVEELDVSIDCLSENYLNIRPRTVALLPQTEPAYLLSEVLNRLSAASSKEVSMKQTYVSEEWKGTVRKRKLNPLCPSVVVKRSREDIVKMVLLQSKAAKGKKRSRYKARQEQPPPLQLSIPMKKKASHKHKHQSSAPSHHQSHSAPSPPPPPPPPPPSRTQPMPTHDIPIPDHIPILSNDGREDLLDADINWTEFSDFLESTDEESSSTLQSFGGFAPQPPTPQNHGIEPVHFNNYGQGHLIHSPFLPPPVPPHMPPLPHHGPHTPVMPYAANMCPPDIPPPHENFFHRVMGPENFLPHGGMGPDGVGYPHSTPMTPGRSYPPGMCPEPPYQQSPAPHHPASHFQTPELGGGYSPHQRHFQGPIIIPKHKGDRGNMSPIVTKMKIKSPVQTKKFLAPVSQTPTSPSHSLNQSTKKRRSPGYSEAGWRCRCGTNNVMFPEKVCAKGKCPCFTKRIACSNCLCRYCHNPFGGREHSTNSPVKKTASESDSCYVAQ